MKKSTLVLFFVILCGLCFSLASADSSCGSDLTWTLHNGTLTISGSGAMRDWYVDSSDSSNAPPWYALREQITNIIIEEGCTSIGRDAFRACEKLKNVSLPESCSYIGESAFQFCISLKTLTIPEGCRLIEDYAFSSCITLQDVTIFEGCTEIGYCSFSDCRSLEQITLPASLTKLGRSQVLRITGNSFRDCEKLTNIDVADGHPVFTSVDGVLFSADMSTLLVYPAGKSEAVYTVPLNVTTIGPEAFYDQKYVKSVVFPEGLTTIEHGAFCDASLTSVTFPTTLTTIQDRAFEGNYKLAEVTLPPKVSYVGTRAFYQCNNLAAVMVMGAETVFDKDEVFLCTSEDFTLYAKTDSFAYGYALKQGIKFVKTDINQNQVLYAQASAEELFSQGKYREAMFAYRSLNTPEALKRSYEIESTYLNDNRLSVTAYRGFKFPQATWSFSRYGVTIRNQDDSAFFFTAYDDVAAKAKLDDYYTAELSDTTFISVDPRTENSCSAVMKDGTVTTLTYSRNLKQWFEDKARTGSIGNRKSDVILTDIVSACDSFALTKNGYLVTSSNTYESIGDWKDWNGLVDFVYNYDVSDMATVVIGLRYDGTVLVNDLHAKSMIKENINGTGSDARPFARSFHSEEWRDIVDIDITKDAIVIGHRRDGSVVASSQWCNGSPFIIEEMKGIGDVKAVRMYGGTNRTKYMDMQFVGLTEEGTLVSTIPNFPHVDNVLAFDLAYHFTNSDDISRSFGGMTVFCLMKDNTFMRFAVANEDPEVEFTLAPVICDESITLINRYLSSNAGSSDHTEELKPAEENGHTRYVIITGNSANIRSGADVNTEKVTSAYKGDQFRLLGEEGNWYKIEVNGQIAYVNKGLSKIK